MTDAGASPSGRRVRVLYFASGLHSGGSELQMLALARHLPRDRFDPEFVLLTDRGIHADLAESEGIRLHVLGVRRPGVNRITFAANVLRAAVRYVTIVRRGRFDIVDAWLYHGYALASLTRPFARIPILLAGRRSLADFKESFGPIDRVIDHIAKRVPDLIVANSYFVRDDAVRREKVPSSKLVVIRNGVDIPRPPYMEQRAIARKSWGVANDELVVGCISNYKPGKGLESLIDVFADVVTQAPRLRLVLIGEGALRPSLMAIASRRGVADRVVLHGLAPDPRPLHGGIDIFVHPSETEGLPNAVLEAAAAGLPIVATDAGGTSEIVIDGVTGLLVPVGDGAALGAGIMRLIDDPDLRAKLASAARRHAAETFGMSRFVAETAALYERLVRDRRSA